MLIGQQVGKISPKNRLAIPAKFRKELGGIVVISYGYEGCLILFSKKQFEDQINQAIAGPLTIKNVRQTARFLLSQAEEIELDAQGRFVMPEHLKNYAAISVEVVFVGLLRWVEIWDLQIWNQISKKLAKGKAGNTRSI